MTDGGGAAARRGGARRPRPSVAHRSDRRLLGGPTGGAAGRQTPPETPTRRQPAAAPPEKWAGAERHSTALQTAPVDRAGRRGQQTPREAKTVERFPAEPSAPVQRLMKFTDRDLKLGPSWSLGQFRGLPSVRAWSQLRKCTFELLEVLGVAWMFNLGRRGRKVRYRHGAKHCGRGGSGGK